MFEVNYLAVLVSTLASFALGFLWYSDALCGKAWRKYTGISDKEMKEGGGKAMAVASLMGMAGTFVMMFMLANVIDLMGAVTPKEGLEAAFWVWLGFVATTHFSKWVWSNKSFNLFLIDASHHLWAMLVGGAILTVWV